MKPQSLFSEADQNAIREATRSAEAKTSGEIVPVVVGECDDYDEAAWKAAAIGALLTSIGSAVVLFFGNFWANTDLIWCSLATMSGAAFGFVAAKMSPALRRALIAQETIDLRVMRRAHQAFLEEEVFSTRERTGILIFLALFEHRVVVLGDEAINRAVEKAEWEAIVSHLIQAIRSGEPAQALIKAIDECGQLLERHGVDIRPDDIDELSDGVRLEER
ncbi:MAG: hypothetical protein GY906_35690 [bacterium]|nr:hypothetical protein [bacterium]